MAAERKKAGLSQEDLAFRADLHRTEVSLSETGKRKPRLDTHGETRRRARSSGEALVDGVSWRVMPTGIDGLHPAAEASDGDLELGEELEDPLGVADAL